MAVPLSQAIALRATLRARDEFSRALRALPPARLLWQPGGLAPHALRIAAHCATSNLFLAAVFSGTELPYRTEDDRRAAIDECATLERAEALLNRSVTAVCDAIVTVPDRRLDDPVSMPWGERMPLALGLLSPCEHMQYHLGQLNLIQTLLGDDDYH